MSYTKLLESSVMSSVIIPDSSTSVEEILAPSSVLKSPSTVVDNLNTGNGCASGVEVTRTVKVRNLGCPRGSKVFPLVPGTKRPGNAHAHLEAIPAEDYQGGSDYGISLDGQYLVIDIDDIGKAPAGFLAKLKESPTWTQKTRRGHHYLYTIPSGFEGTNGKTPGNSGDIKVNGYIVGPNSMVNKDADGTPLEDFTYSIVDSRDPAAAPMWMLNSIAKAQEKTPVTPAAEGFVNIDEIVDMDENGHSVTDRVVMCSRVSKLIDGGVDWVEAADIIFMAQSAICEHWIKAKPFTIKEVRKMGEDWAAKKTSGTAETVGGDTGNRFINAMLLDYTATTFEELIPGLIYRGKYHSEYGPSGVNKTGIAAQKAAIISKTGYNIGFVGSEDGNEDFARRYFASGGIMKRLFVFKRDAKHILLAKKHEAELRADIVQNDLVYLIFDSIMDHRDTPNRNDNAADIARNWAGATSRVSLDTNCAISGIAHENNAGDLEGSGQQTAKARLQVHYKRRNANSTSITVTKTNVSEKDAVFTATAEVMLSRNPLTGAVDQKKVWNADGTFTMVDLTIFVCTGITQDPKGSVNIEDIPDPTEGARKKRVATLVQWWQVNPGPHSVADIKKVDVKGVARDKVADTLADRAFVLITGASSTNKSPVYDLRAELYV